MKRIITLLLAALLTVFLTACGENVSESEETIPEETQKEAAMTVTLKPDIPGDFDITDEDLDAVREVLEVRLSDVTQSDYDISADNDTNYIVIRFSEAIPEEDLDSLLYIRSALTFRDSDGNTLMDNTDVEKASANINLESEDYLILINFTEEGGKKFKKITEEHIEEPIMIYLDDTLLSSPVVKAPITDGSAQITGDFTAEEATELAARINSSLLPFASLSIISVD